MVSICFGRKEPAFERSTDIIKVYRRRALLDDPSLPSCPMHSIEGAPHALASGRRAHRSSPAFDERAASGRSHRAFGDAMKEASIDKSGAVCTSPAANGRQRRIRVPASGSSNRSRWLPSSESADAGCHGLTLRTADRSAGGAPFQPQDALGTDPESRRFPCISRATRLSQPPSTQNPRQQVSDT